MAALETPKAILNAYEICTASPRMFGIAISGGDLRRCMQVTQTPEGIELFVARGQTVLAAELPEFSVLTRCLRIWMIWKDSRMK